MYCPRCGQEQVSRNLRFCSNCGLPMGLVAEILANEGALPRLLELEKKKNIFTRRNGMIFSLFWFIFFVPFMSAICSMFPFGYVLLPFFPVFGCFSSLLIFLFSVFFLSSSEDKTQRNYIQKQNASRDLSGQNARQSSLPPQQTQVARDYVSSSPGSWKAPDTGELAHPGSVTEETTKLLQKDE